MIFLQQPISCWFFSSFAVFYFFSRPSFSCFSNLFSLLLFAGFSLSLPFSLPVAGVRDFCFTSFSFLFLRLFCALYTFGIWVGCCHLLGGFFVCVSFGLPSLDRYLQNNIAKAWTATLDRKSWSLSLFVSPFLTKLLHVYESIFNWLSLAATAAATTTFTALLFLCFTLASFFFLLYTISFRDKSKIQIQSIGKGLWKRSQKRVREIQNPTNGKKERKKQHTEKKERSEKDREKR